MQWYELLFSAISTRSFSVLWYWIALIGFWSVVQARVMGVPVALISDTRSDPRAADDMLWLARFDVRRRLSRPPAVRVAAVAGAAFILSILILNAALGLEAAQALAFIAVPWCLIEALRERLARRLAAEGPNAEALAQILLWHRFAVQIIASISIFLAVVWGVLRLLILSI